MNFQPVILETPEVIPVPAPAPKPKKRFRNFYLIYQMGKHKKKLLDKAIDLAEQMISLQMKPKVMQKSIRLEYGFTARQVRSIVRNARPRKHRERS